jgi:hypothetical protein
VDVQPERLLASRRRARRAVVAERTPGLQEDRVEEVLEGAAHVAEVRGGAEQVAVRRQHLARVRLERRPDHHLDPFDRVVVGAGDDGVGQLLDRMGRGVVDDQQTGHVPEPALPSTV